VNSDVRQLLKDHSLRLTQGRADILGYFLNKNVAIFHGDIENQMDGKYDRVTIYRTLKSFLENGLIHKVLDDKGAARYALSTHAHSGEHKHHNHVHFKCSKCDQTTCLDDVLIPEVVLPEGFQVAESNFLMTGICDKCSAL